MSDSVDEDWGVKFGELKTLVHQEMKAFCSSFQDSITTELQNLTEVMQDMVKQQKEDRIAITRLEKQPPGLEMPLSTKAVAGLGGPPPMSASAKAALDTTNTIPRIPTPAASAAFLLARLGTGEELLQPRPTSPVGWRTRPGDQADTRPPRFHKLEFPTYDGESDPLPWLNRCEQFFCRSAHAGQRANMAGILPPDGAG
jgi:hypothetical protein